MVSVDGGAVFDTTISNSLLDVYSGSVAFDTTLYNSTEIVLSGGATIGTAMNSDAEMVVYGTAIGTTISSFSEQIVDSGGKASDTRINSDGFEFVAFDGEALSTMINGGSMEVDSGALTSGTTVSFDGLIAGFASPHGVTEEIDLVDIAFGANTKVSFSEASNHLSGTLTVTSGSETANLTLLGQYSTANFHLASDGQGGTLVTDPPSPVGSAASPVVAAHT
jgi:autotransporter passenger strand-loop-strand repeat protein